MIYASLRRFFLLYFRSFFNSSRRCRRPSFFSTIPSTTITRSRHSMVPASSSLLDMVSCPKVPQRTSIPERPAQIAWPCSLRHCHCSTLRYLPLLLWSSWSYMFWMAKVPDNNSEVYDVGDRRPTQESLV